MRNRAMLFISVLLVAGLWSCRKKFNSPSWDVDVLTPVVKTKLTIDDIGDTLYTIDTADGSVIIAYDNPIYTMNTDELFVLPDTSIVKSASLINGLNVGPGQPIYLSTETTKFGLSGAELSYATVASGVLELEITSTITEPTELVLSVPCATQSGVVFNVTEPVAAAPVGQSTTHTVQFNLAGYDLDLRGINKNDYNTIYYDIQARLSNTSPGYTVQSTDAVTMKIAFKDLEPYYAQGYFGKNSINIGPESQKFSFLKKVAGGSLDLDQVKIWIEFINGIGVDANLRLKRLESFNANNYTTVALNHNLIGQNINMNRAVKTFSTPPVTPSVYSVYLDNNNSNVDQFIENLPTDLVYELEGEVNPLGNVMNGNDFYYQNYLLQANLKTEIPLDLAMNRLLLVDTIDFTWEDNTLDRIQDGYFTLHADNHFPFDATIDLIVLDTNYNPITTLISKGKIQEGVTDAQNIVIGATSSTIKMPVNSWKIKELKNAKYMMLRTELNTVDAPNRIKIYENYYIDLKVVGDFTYRAGLN